ncbi:axonemal dynein light chain domain-containing protein 1 [Phaethornis superciliosus]
MLDPIRPVSSSLEDSFVPEEVFQSLACASSSLYSLEYLKLREASKTTMGFRRGILADSLVPKEFHIVKSRGVLPLKYLDDKYTTLLKDREKKLRLFPSVKPSGRLEVMQLMEVMDSMLEKAGVDKLIRITGPSQLHDSLELMRAEQNIYNIVFHELIRQVSVDCVERGQLLSKLRQRYVSLLERIPEQMKTLYKKMMAQQLINRHITEELIHFKDSVRQLASELCEVREHDFKVTKEAEKAQEELAEAMLEAEAKADLLEEYRDLYELQRRRLEEQVLLLAQERDIWCSAAYGLALKDTGDLADLQEETDQISERLGQFGAEIEHSEESSQAKLQIVCSKLNKQLQSFQCFQDSSALMNEELLDEILQDIKSMINILREDLEQYGGEVHLGKAESLRSIASLQEHWMELGQTVLNRHWHLDGVLSPQHTALEEIKQRAHELYQQYNRRISGSNGTATILTALVKSMEDWSLKVQKLKPSSGMHQAELWAFYQEIPVWLAQVEAVISCIGSSQLHEAESDKKQHFPVALREFLKMIQQWVLSMNKEIEKNITFLNEKVAELHQNLTLWLVNLLRHMTANSTSRECPPRQESGDKMDEELRLLGTHKLQHEAGELVAEMDRLSCFIVRCCREIVNALVRKKRLEMDLEADFELKQLSKIKDECCAWVQVCSLLLSEIKGTPVSFLDLEDLRNLFGSEELQSKLQLKDTNIFSTREQLEAEDATSSRKPEQPGASVDYLTEDDEATEDMIRYVGHDSNIHLKSLKSDIVSVTGGDMTATKSSTPFSQKEFEALATLEHLQAQLLETEIRAQNAEKRSEDLEEKLEEALQRIKVLECELENEGKVIPEAT